MEKFEKELLLELHGINQNLKYISDYLLNTMTKNDKHFDNMRRSISVIATDNHSAMEAKAKAFNSITSIIEDHKDTIISALDELDNALQGDIPKTEENEESEGSSEEVVLRSADELLYSEYVSPIEDLGFKIRTFNCVHRTGINTLGDLCSCTRDELLKRISAKMVDGEIIPVLIDHGYKLRTSEEQETETNYKETEEE